MQLWWRWVGLTWSLLLLMRAIGCSKEALKQHGIEVEDGKVKKRLIEF